MCRIFYTFVDISDAFAPKRKHKICSHAAYGLLKKCALKCGFDVSDFEIIRNEHGKPYLKNSEFFFNISHSDDFVCLVISDREVGIDTQRVGDVNPDVVKRFLKKESLGELENTYLWTDYEAIGKYFGVGIPHSIELVPSIAIDHFRVGDFCISLCREFEDVPHAPETISVK